MKDRPRIPFDSLVLVYFASLTISLAALIITLYRLFAQC